jgi:hypothetical protein
LQNHEGLKTIGMLASLALTFSVSVWAFGWCIGSLTGAAIVVSGFWVASKVAGKVR